MVENFLLVQIMLAEGDEPCFQTTNILLSVGLNGLIQMIGCKYNLNRSSTKNKNPKQREKVQINAKGTRSGPVVSDPVHFLH